MGIWERLGNVVKSYLNDDAGQTGGGSSFAKTSDPDLETAYEELDEFLKGTPDQKFRTEKSSGAAQAVRRNPPEEILRDFEELGLSPDAPVQECKEAYKKLLKIHHPDRYANDRENMEKATEKTARINAAWQRLENWFRLINDNGS